MDDLGEIRERIARRTEERRTAWLEGQRRRYFGWMLTATVFAVLVTFIAAYAKSMTFTVIAGYLWLFASNRLVEHRRVKRWLARARPIGEKERLIWARIFYDEISHPSVWLRTSTRIGAVTAGAFVIVVSAVVVATSGLWIRLLYGIAYGLLGLYTFAWVMAKRRHSRERDDYSALSREVWRDLT